MNRVVACIGIGLLISISTIISCRGKDSVVPKRTADETKVSKM